MKRILMTGCWCFLVAAVATMQEHPLKVFVTAEILDQQGWVAPAAKDLADSANDVVSAIRIKHKRLVVVVDRREADIVVRVVERHEVDTGRTAIATGQGYAIAKPLLGRSVVAAVHAGDRDFRFVGTTNKRYWSSAAEDLAKDLESWAVQNRERILAAGQGRK